MTESTSSRARTDLDFADVCCLEDRKGGFNIAYSAILDYTYFAILPSFNFRDSDSDVVRDV